MTRAVVGLISLAVLAAGGAAPAEEEPHRFQGNWSAAGRRDTLPTEGNGTASIVYLSGAVVLTVGEGLSRGFRGEAITFDDGRELRVGRWVWTDEHGDQIFSALEGEPLDTGRRILGRITGGTGRYRGITGELELTWQYVVHADDGTIQGRSTDLRGRYVPATDRR